MSTSEGRASSKTKTAVDNEPLDGDSSEGADPVESRLNDGLLGAEPILPSVVNALALCMRATSNPQRLRDGIKEVARAAAMSSGCAHSVRRTYIIPEAIFKYEVPGIHTRNTSQVILVQVYVVSPYVRA